MGGKVRGIRRIQKASLALVILLMVLSFVLPARAEALKVSGADHIYTAEASDAGIDVLTVTGKKGDTIYVSMLHGDEVIASHLAFTLDDSNAEADENGDMVGVVSVNLNAQAFKPGDSYLIRVYADRAEKNLIYEGNIITYYATYGNATAPLVVRTLAANEQRPLNVPQTLEHDSITYELSDKSAKEINGKQCYVYTESSEIADSIEAHVYYYDAENASGDPIKTTTLTLEKGSSQTVEIQSVIAADNGKDFYRTIQLTDTVTLSYPGTTEYSIMCQKLSEDWGETASFFMAYIRFVDAEGNALMARDKIVVNKPFIYTAPTKLYVNDGGVVKEYQIQDKDKAAVKLAPGDAEGEATYDIVYEPVSENAERTWTVVLINGSVSPKDSNREIKRITYKGKPGESATHTTEQKIDVDGVAYVPTASMKESYTHEFSVAAMDIQQDIYYVPDGYVPPEAYEVVVKYVDIATNEVITSETYTASPSMRSDLEITGPESFTYGGVEWIRLNGQEDPIRHCFYAEAREYVIYYRDINDDLHKDTIIRKVRVEYIDEEGNTIYRPITIIDDGTTDNGVVDGGTINRGTVNLGTVDNGTTDNGVVDGGTTDNGITDGGTTTIYVNGTNADGTNTGGTNAGGQTDGGAAATNTGLATGTDLLSINGGDNDALVGTNGADTASMRIDDNETPLAGPGAADAAGKLDNGAAIAGGIAAAIAAAVAFFLFFIYKRRKKSEDDASDDEHSVQ